MAYDTSNPPRLIQGPLFRRPDLLATATDGGNVLAKYGPQFWIYTSTDVSTVVDADGFFSNGYNLGMRTGDIVWVTEMTSGGATRLTTIHAVNRATATGGVDLQDGTTVAKTTDSD